MVTQLYSNFSVVAVRNNSLSETPSNNLRGGWAWRLPCFVKFTCPRSLGIAHKHDNENSTSEIIENTKPLFVRSATSSMSGIGTFPNRSKVDFLSPTDAARQAGRTAQPSSEQKASA